MSERFEGFSHEIIDTGEAVIHTWIAGQGEPLLLIHGYPETHMAWHKVAPVLAEQYKVVAVDLRGYGDSSCPADDPEHYSYSKRAMGEDMFRVMTHLGIDSFFLMGHDRGARVCHQMINDHPERIRKAVFLDIVSTLDMYQATDMQLASIYYHWFFLIQKNDIPEHMIMGDPRRVMDNFMAFSRKDGDTTFPDDVKEHYYEKFENPEVIHATCEDYRAGATCDLDHIEEALNKGKFDVPLMTVWAGKALDRFDVLGSWSRYGSNVTGFKLENCGHFIPEEKPEEVIRIAKSFFTE